MGKRFGRNQKRKAREEIAALKAQCEKMWGDIAAANQRAHQAEAAIDGARRILPPYCVALPPQILDMSGFSTEARRSMQMPQSGLRPYSAYSLKDKILQLNVMLHHVDVDKLTGALHVRLRYRDDVLGYAATEEAVQTIPAKELARIVADNVAHAVVRKLKG